MHVGENHGLSVTHMLFVVVVLDSSCLHLFFLSREDVAFSSSLPRLLSL